MQAKIWKRLVSYIVDFIIIGILLWIVKMIFVNDNVIHLQQQEQALFDLVLEGNAHFISFFKDYFKVMYEMDKALVGIHIFEAFLIAIYFIFVPLLLNGQTLGQKLLHIQTVTYQEQLPSFNQFLIRTICLQGFGSLLLTLIFIYIIPSSIYYGFSSLLALIEFAILVTSAVFILKHKDQKGIADIWSKTMVIERRI